MTFEEIQSSIFDVSCALAGCHDVGGAQEGMILARGFSYASTVDVPSSQRPDLDRIEPGDPDASYLVRKIRGDGDIVGGRMPLDRDALAADRIDALVQWIRDGAPEE